MVVVSAKRQTLWLRTASTARLGIVPKATSLRLVIRTLLLAAVAGEEPDSHKARASVAAAAKRAERGRDAYDARCRKPSPLFRLTKAVAESLIATTSGRYSGATTRVSVPV